mmetsp:Transcript_9254/g.15557  ORF Transcript_9254/g.15557 Transcript_9254/m.15557 type:complete len:93 (+) Transcript_9254:616-894(+)
MTVRFSKMIQLKIYKDINQALLQMQNFEHDMIAAAFEEQKKQEKFDQMEAQVRATEEKRKNCPFNGDLDKYEQDPSIQIQQARYSAYSQGNL